MKPVTLNPPMFVSTSSKIAGQYRYEPAGKKTIKALWIALVYFGLHTTAFAVELATPPIWFFEEFGPMDGAANCTAVNLHDKPIAVRVTLIHHNEDEFTFEGGFPIGPDPLNSREFEQVLEPGDATSVTLQGELGFDALLVRCTVEYRGNPNKVKAALILEHTARQKSIAVAAEIVRFGNNKSDPRIE